MSASANRPPVIHAPTSEDVGRLCKRLGVSPYVAAALLPWGDLSSDQSDSNFGRECASCGRPVRAGERLYHTQCAALSVDELRTFARLLLLAASKP